MHPTLSCATSIIHPRRQLTPTYPSIHPTTTPHPHIYHLHPTPPPTPSGVIGVLGALSKGSETRTRRVCAVILQNLSGGPTNQPLALFLAITYPSTYIYPLLPHSLISLTSLPGRNGSKRGGTIRP